MAFVGVAALSSCRLAPALLSASSITKSFEGVSALRHVSFELQAGEVHALVGENGAGKSTLIKIMTGAERPDAGRLTVAGRDVPHMTPALARALGIAAIYQQPSLFPDLTVAENVALDARDRRHLAPRRWSERRRRARALLEEVGSTVDPARLAGSLSMPEQQLVEIAKAVGADAKVVIMDEPTASLMDDEVERLFAVIRQLRAQGCGIIYISHRLEEVFAMSDRITVLRDGETIATRATETLDRPALIQTMVGRTLKETKPRQAVATGDVALELRHLSNRELGLSDVSISVQRGEMLGIAGLVGSGRTELAETLFGLAPADGGEVLVRGVPVRIGSPLEAIQLGIGYVPEDRRRHGVMLEMSIAENTSLASLGAVSSRGLIDRAAERRLAEGHVERLRIKTPSVSTDVGRSVRRQPAEGRARAVAVDRARHSHSRRADAGRRRRREGRDPRADARAGGTRARDPDDLVGAARGAQHERSHRGHACRHGQRRAGSRRSDAGPDHGAGAGAADADVSGWG